MELLNSTPYGAGFFNTVVSDTGLLGAVVCKPTFRIEPTEGTDLLPAPEDPWPVTNEPVETDWGTFDGELPFIRRGVDLIFVGNVHAPHGQAIPVLDVDVAVGSAFRRTLRVFGDRWWVRSGEQLVPSRPEPFESMPLSYAHAFGGTCEVETGEMDWPANPDGKGFYVEAWQAEHQPLPNIEDPNRLIRSWDDRPDTIGTAPYPVKWSLRAVNAVEIDESHPDGPRVERILPTYFNNAHPRMIVTDPVGPGDEVSVTHARPEGQLRFRIPDLRMHVHVQLEERNFVFPMHLEQITVIGEERRVMFSLRTCFRYDVIPLERRVVTIRPGPVPDDVPPSYPYDLDELEAFA